jgi:hypothetical protein
MLFNNPVRTSKRTPHFTVTEINWLTLFKFNPLQPKLVQMLFNNPVRTSKRTPHFTITEINWSMLLTYKRPCSVSLHAGGSPVSVQQASALKKSVGIAGRD